MNNAITKVNINEKDYKINPFHIDLLNLLGPTLGIVWGNHAIHNFINQCVYHLQKDVNGAEINTYELERCINKFVENYKLAIKSITEDRNLKINKNVGVVTYISDDKLRFKIGDKRYYTLSTNFKLLDADKVVKKEEVKETKTQDIGKFYKVPYEQFKKDFIEANEGTLKSENDEYIYEIWKSIILPKRSTKNASGYDFYLPTAVEFKYNTSVKIPTGVGIKFFRDGYDLSIVPRSGLGSKHRIMLNNTIGIIDNDYWMADNHGHIIINMTMMNDEPPVFLNKDERFAQGIVRQYFTLKENKNKLPDRKGGFGSTGK